MVRYLHHYSKFDTATQLRRKLIEVFGELVPDKEFSVGYFEGQQHCKIWLASNQDFAAMYRKYPKGEITLWCNGRSSTDEDDDKVNESAKKKKKDGDKVTRRQEKESDIDEVFKQLKEKHGVTYDNPKMRLWARSICGNLHDDLDVPPDLPVFRDKTPKKNKESLSEALSGAAITFANAFKTDTNVQTVQTVQTTECSTVPLSPGKTVELRMKNFEQLRYLQQLVDDGILTSKDYIEQKDKILSSLRNLN